jgi:hypothetical protein
MQGKDRFLIHHVGRDVFPSKEIKYFEWWAVCVFQRGSE